jgi:anaerobic ribonucleoside-triphosphate reductase
MKKQKKTETIKVVRCEIFSRVVGYYRPVQDWNEGKKEEFKDRKYLKFKR